METNQPSRGEVYTSPQKNTMNLTRPSVKGSIVPQGKVLGDEVPRIGRVQGYSLKF